ncbi:hypothetical protein SELMODRAFT_415214 [Selaginella moellendorffii]|uniref:RING-type E3 ubiquitin transferase BRCA1 n=1 Tax=Selaginella moellendorffii TaxID=88036 RepID=D8RVD9_SELML|nr:uncharacterized protein LOC9637847 [Selaginella moellendorffii]EFJ23938.1 hypothetical protein SELMODRAFT_415214 [Selaginella moellendorffii]|eukprot:XP_002975153.1 uncharacterized protein LOC9637847 [Selaginella moellendorffii]
MEENAGGGAGVILPARRCSTAETITIEDSDQDREDYGCGDGRHSVPGMDSLIVTISGYTGTQRSRVVALINRTGALFLGDLSTSHTHLVCWSFTGKKYHLSKELGIKIVNHQWFEDCLRAGRRLPEEPYTHKSGKEVGPVTYREVRRAGGYTAREDVTGPQEPQASCLDQDARSPTPHHQSTTPPRPRERARREPSTRSGKENKRCRPRNHGEKSILTGLDAFLLEDEIAESSKRSAPPSRDRETKRKHENKYLEGFRDLSRESTSRRKVLQPVTKNSHTTKRKVEVQLDAYFPPKTSPKLQPFQPPLHIDDASNPRDLGASSAGTAPRSESPSTRRLSTSSSSSEDVACVICHDENQTNVEGVLACGHQFCFDCIKKWSQHSGSANTPKCPLCKAPFDFITKREPFISLADDDENKRYFETIVAIEKKIQRTRANAFPVARSCVVCSGQDAEELLLVCNVCRSRAVHTFCLDPPRVDALYPWECRVCLEQGRRYRL